MLARTNLLEKPSVLEHLAQIQRVLPPAIVLAVLLYESIFEFVLADRVAGGVRFGIELLVFGFAGALVSWIVLEWIRRRAEKETEAAQTAARRDRLLATISSDSADAIFLLDPEGHIQTWNRGAEQMFGYRAEEILTQDCDVLIPPPLSEHREPEALQRQLAAQGYVRNYITTRQTKTGQILTVEVTRTLLHDAQNRVFGSSVIMRDVTERERARVQIQELNRYLETQVAERTKALSHANEELRAHERELEKANAELEELDALKSEFVSLVSHELRAPLSNISGSLQLLLADDGVNSLTADQREMLTLANEQVDHLARLVKGILNVSRIEAGEMHLQLKAFDVNGLVERVLAQWRSCASDFAWSGPGTENLPSVWGDRDRVEQVLMNLLDNAYKYSDPGSTIRVGTELINNQIVISVGDQGKGIPPQELEKIFDKFHRVERGDARETYGYGLGLYISRKLIESMGGRLWVESELGSGSTFYFSLPLAGGGERNGESPV